MKIISKKTLLQALQSFFTSWALMKASRMEPGNIFTLIFFLLCFLFYRYTETRILQSGVQDSRSLSRISAVLAVIFSALYMTVDYPRYIDALSNRLFRLGIIAATLCGFLSLFYYLAKFLLSFAGDKPLLNTLFFVNIKTPIETAKAANTAEATDTSKATNTVKAAVIGRAGGADCSARGFSKALNILRSFYYKHTGLCAFLLCMLCWLPYFLYQYPGIMTPDSVNQFEQVLHLIPYSNHHPWMHTLLIGFFYNIGLKLTGSMLVALSLYTFFQMCLLAGSVCYFINTIKSFRVKPSVCFCTTLFYALVPYHAVFSVTIWKDIPFAAAVMMFGCSLLRLLFEKPENKPEKG
ncbi:MAG: DUF6020 family protein, partial [Clostridium sp.]|nr:DUF6020 family protein [Clostridium sp.]